MNNVLPEDTPGPLDLTLDELTILVGSNVKKEEKGVEQNSMPDKAKFAVEQKWRLFENRLKYAWDYFDFHARQRTTMFNFFVLFVGFVLNAYATLLKDHSYIAMIVAFVGAILVIFFLMFDRRNEELVHIAEAVLESLEKDVLFKDYKRTVPWPKRRGWWRMKEPSTPDTQLGILLRQTADKDAEETPGKKLGKSKYEHGRSLPWFQLLIFFVFLGLAVLAAYPWLQQIRVCGHAAHDGGIW
jgi:hypothetical protein